MIYFRKTFYIFASTFKVQYLNKTIFYLLFTRIFNILDFKIKIKFLTEYFGDFKRILNFNFL